MTDLEKRCIETLKLRGGWLVCHYLGYGFRYWIEYNLGDTVSIIDFDYNKGVSIDFLNHFNFSMQDQYTNRRFYILK